MKRDNSRAGGDKGGARKAMMEEALAELNSKSSDELATEYPFFYELDANKDLAITAFEWAALFFDSPEDESAYTKGEMVARLLDNAQVMCHDPSAKIVRELTADQVLELSEDSEDEINEDDDSAISQYNKAKKEAQRGYLMKTLADFYFSFDQNRNGVLDDAEMSSSFDFWSAEDQSE